MDGAQGLEGVVVLAATSRPDMIDPALLRPGRLDKSILVNFPSEIERKDIIERISKTIPLSNAVSIEELAAKTSGFSGADLQSLLYTAQLASINEHISNTTVNEMKRTEIPFQILQGNIDPKQIRKNLDTNHQLESNNSPEGDDAVIRVQPYHLESALKESKPSLRESELKKFSSVYAQFDSKSIVTTNVGSKASFA